LPDASFLGGEKEAERAVHVDREICRRVLDRRRNPRFGGEVHHGVHLVQDALAEASVTDISDDEFDVIGGLGPALV
jgi:hypothetical protein